MNHTTICDWKKVGVNKKLKQNVDVWPSILYFDVCEIENSFFHFDHRKCFKLIFPIILVFNGSTSKFKTFFFFLNLGKFFSFRFGRVQLFPKNTGSRSDNYRQGYVVLFTEHIHEHNFNNFRRTWGSRCFVIGIITHIYSETIIVSKRRLQNVLRYIYTTFSSRRTFFFITGVHELNC